MEQENLIKTDSTLYTPAQLGQRCPVCNGFGSLKYGEIKCHGCEGRGWILVPVKEIERKSYDNDNR